jgi:predicted aconitase with swiveling domain
LFVVPALFFGGVEPAAGFVPDPSSFLLGYSNPNDSEGVLDLILCGAHLVILTTGRGSVIGSVLYIRA